MEKHIKRLHLLDVVCKQIHFASDSAEVRAEINNIRQPILAAIAELTDDIQEDSEEFALTIISESRPRLEALLIEMGALIPCIDDDSVADTERSPTFKQ